MRFKVHYIDKTCIFTVIAPSTTLLDLDSRVLNALKLIDEPGSNLLIPESIERIVQYSLMNTLETPPPRDLHLHLI
jgi:hypothetical protein